MEFLDKSVSPKIEQTISCTISGLAQDTQVKWIDPNDNEISESDTNNYVIDQGTLFLDKKSSILTIKKVVLQSLSTSSIFKCKLKSAAYPDYSPDVVNEMTLTLLELGKNCFYFNIFV